ncbi:MAG: SLC13 family permease, partial [Elusimicrobiales bacterium]|nr:SLC13 family permease [Elusimicrobiales bacterium]
FQRALKMVDWEVIIFLFCMFCVGALFEISGYIERFENKLFSGERNFDKNLYLFIFVSAFLSAVLMNDTVAILGVPVIFSLSRRYQISAKPLIFALAFSVTVGSVFSPIGNPQNLLIAIKSEIKNPFFSFIKHLIVPSVINLWIIFWIIKIYYRKEISGISQFKNVSFTLKCKWLYWLSHFTMALLISLIIIKIYFSINGREISLVNIALISSIPALLFSFNQIKIIKMVDFKTLIFFVSMFIVTGSAWESGYIQKVLLTEKVNLLSIEFIFILSILFSQLISNVPLVALFMPVFLSLGAGEKTYLSLAAASTIAGNLSLLGAASNVIIIQNIENRGGESFSGWEFFKLGFPVTLINSLVYYLFLKFFN